MGAPQISSIFIAPLHCDSIISSHLRNSYTHCSYFSTCMFLLLRGVTSWKTGTSPKVLGNRKICKDTSYSACIHFLRRNEWEDYNFFFICFHIIELVVSGICIAFVIKKINEEKGKKGQRKKEKERIIRKRTFTPLVWLSG
uniref:Uncharacterized protein n=1 Tax=Myotis myotis TaxID=51298 RepID=A0A7J7WHZ4_MYOMY|nr:hypothetical protein mMyoMyo1_012049 [Myotis myotis]